MTAKTQLIQPGPLQITPTAAHSVRTGAETTRAFASVLDQHTAATIEQTPRDEPGRPDTNEPNSATDQQDASAHHESSADAPASDAPDQELPSEPSAQTTDAEVPVGTTQEDAAVLDEHPATEPDSRPVTDSSDTLDVQPVPVPQETENPEAGETPLPKGDSHPGQIPSSDTGSDTNQLQDHRPPAGDPPPVPDADADAGRPAPQAPVPAQGEQPSGPVAVEQPPVEPSSPDALVALSRQAEQSKFQIQGVARVLTHAASVNVAAVAQQELAGNTNLSPATPIDQNLGSDQLVPGFSSDLRPQPTPPPADATANTPPPPPSIDNGQPIRFAPPGQPGDGGGKGIPQSNHATGGNPAAPSSGSGFPVRRGRCDASSNQRRS